MPDPTQPDRQELIQILRLDYARRLTHALQGVAMLPPLLQERTDLTLPPAPPIFGDRQEEHSHPSPPVDSVASDEARPGLLIVGAAGSGKTIFLLDLAQKLLSSAENDPTQPVPVIMNLASWSSNEPSLASWIRNQLLLISAPHVSEAWLVEVHQWQPLLDDLDKVPLSARNACVEAINIYRQTYNASLMVCSRTLEYLALEQRLVLPTALEIQPVGARFISPASQPVGRAYKSRPYGWRLFRRQ